MLRVWGGGLGVAGFVVGVGVAVGFGVVAGGLGAAILAAAAASRAVVAARCLLVGEPGGLLTSGLCGGAHAGLARLLVPAGLLRGGEALLTRLLEGDGGLLESGQLLGQRFLLGG